MIRVEKAESPPDFDERVGNPGQIVLWELSGDPRAPLRSGPKRKHLAPLWTELLPYMRKVYRRMCAYLAQRVPKGTGCDSVEEDWFALDLESFKVYARPALDGVQPDLVQNTLDLLNASSFCEARQWYVSRYLGIPLEEDDPEEAMALSQLRHEAPFVAAELARQRKLLAKDQRAATDGESTREQENQRARGRPGFAPCTRLPGLVAAEAPGHPGSPHGKNPSV